MTTSRAFALFIFFAILSSPSSPRASISTVTAPAPGAFLSSSDIPTVTGQNTLSLSGSWRFTYLDGDMDDYWLRIQGSTGTEYIHLPQEDEGPYSRTFTQTGAWSVAVLVDPNDDPDCALVSCPPAFIELHQLDEDNFDLLVEDQAPPGDLVMRLERANCPSAVPTPAPNTAPMPPPVRVNFEVEATKSAIDYVMTTVRARPQNANATEHQIAEQAWAAIVDARHNFYGAGEFELLRGAPISVLANADHFLQTYSIKTGSTLSENPLSATIIGLVIDPAYNLAKQISQSCGFELLPTSTAPQAPPNFDFWSLAGAWAGEGTGYLGQPQVSGSVEPVYSDSNQNIHMFSVDEGVDVPIDPPAASKFRYRILSGSSFQSFMIPPDSGAGAGPFTLSFAGATVQLNAGQKYTFSSFVIDFTVDGLAVGPDHFMSVVAFNDTGLQVFSQSADPPVETAPHVELHPQDQVAAEGTTASFIAVGGAAPLPAYRWQVSVDGGSVWSDIDDGAEYAGTATPKLNVLSVSSAVANRKYRLTLTNHLGTVASQPAVVRVSVPAGVEIVANGNFAAGLGGWQTFALPDPSYIVASTTGGSLEFYRQPAPANVFGQATVFQHTGKSLLGGTPVAATFDLANTSSVRKRVSVLILNSDFADLAVCTFWLPAQAPLQTYSMRTHTTQAWTNAAIYFYAATEGSAGGSYVIDNVSMTFAANVSDDRTDCVDPTAPSGPPGAAGTEMITNGSFDNGVTGWSVFGELTSQIDSGVFEFYRPIGPGPAGVVLQPTGQPVAANTVLLAGLDLGNSSAVRKRVTVLVHDFDFSDLAACTFWLVPDQPLSRYNVRAFTTEAWSNATVSIYAATVGVESWVQLDDVSLRQRADLTTQGTECVEPDDPNVDPQSPPDSQTGVPPATVAFTPFVPPSGTNSIQDAAAREHGESTQPPDASAGWFIEAAGCGFGVRELPEASDEERRWYHVIINCGSTVDEVFIELHRLEPVVEVVQDAQGRIQLVLFEAGTYTNLITSSAIRSLDWSRSGGRGPAKYGLPCPSTTGCR